MGKLLIVGTVAFDAIETPFGKTDKIARLVIAAIIIILDFAGILTGTLSWILSIVAIVLAATALIDFCPLYKLIGMSTKEKTNQ